MSPRAKGIAHEGRAFLQSLLELRESDPAAAASIRQALLDELLAWSRASLTARALEQ